MTIINVTLPVGVVKELNDYSKIVNEILKQEISFNILKFSTGSGGINILLDVPEEKIQAITESLKKNNVIVNKKGRVILDEDKCIDCGSCVSLCPTEALLMDDKDLLVFSEDKCIGCYLCVDSCPRFAIEES